MDSCRLISGIVFWFVACLGGAQAWADKKGALASTEVYRPSLFLGGSEVTRGFLKGTMEKVDNAFSMAGIDTYWINLPTKRSMEMAASGRIDGLYIRREKPEEIYSNLVKIDVPILTAVSWVWVNADQACPASIADMRDMVTVDVVGFGFLDTIPELKDVPRETVTDIAAGFKVLTSRRIDYFTISEPAARYYEKEMGVVFKRCFDKPIYNIKQYTFLHKKHAALIPKLEEAFSKVFP